MQTREKVEGDVRPTGGHIFGVRQANGGAQNCTRWICGVQSTTV